MCIIYTVSTCILEHFITQMCTCTKHHNVMYNIHTCTVRILSIYTDVYMYQIYVAFWSKFDQLYICTHIHVHVLSVQERAVYWCYLQYSFTVCVQNTHLYMYIYSIAINKVLIVWDVYNQWPRVWWGQLTLYYPRMFSNVNKLNPYSVVSDHHCKLTHDSQVSLDVFCLWQFNKLNATKLITTTTTTTKGRSKRTKKANDMHFVNRFIAVHVTMRVRVTR